MALQRGWLDDGAIGRLAVEPDAAIAVVLQVNGHQGPATIADAPLQVLIANVTRLLEAPDAATALRERARALVAADPEKSEARLLDALVLHLTGHPREAAAILADALGNHGDDLRVRYLLAVAARAAGDDALLRLAVQRDGRRLEVPELDRAARSLPLPDRVAGAELLRDLR